MQRNKTIWDGKSFDVSFFCQMKYCMINFSQKQTKPIGIKYGMDILLIIRCLIH